MWCKNLDLLLTPPWLAPHSWWLFWVGFLLLEEHHPILIQLWSIPKTGYTSSRSLGWFDVARLFQCCLLPGPRGKPAPLMQAQLKFGDQRHFAISWERGSRQESWWSCEWFDGPPLVSKCTHGLTKNGLYICIWLFLGRIGLGGPGCNEDNHCYGIPNLIRTAQAYMGERRYCAISFSIFRFPIPQSYSTVLFHSPIPQSCLLFRVHKLSIRRGSVEQ